MSFLSEVQYTNLKSLWFKSALLQLVSRLKIVCSVCLITMMFPKIKLRKKYIFFEFEDFFFPIFKKKTRILKIEQISKMRILKILEISDSDFFFKKYFSIFSFFHFFSELDFFSGYNFDAEFSKPSISDVFRAI